MPLHKTDNVDIYFHSQKQESSSDHPALHIILLLKHLKKVLQSIEMRLKEPINLIETHLTAFKGWPRPSSRGQVGVSDVWDVWQDQKEGDSPDQGQEDPRAWPRVGRKQKLPISTKKTLKGIF